MAELVATKIRALYQRSKGRDVFDLWLALTALEVAPDEIAAAFAPYRPAAWTPRLAELNLERKLADPAFGHDLDALVSQAPADFNIETGARATLDRIIPLVPDR